MPVHETQGLGRHLGEGQGPFFLLRPGKSLSKAPSVFLNSETTKGTANKLGQGVEWGVGEMGFLLMGMGFLFRGMKVF